MAHYMGHKSSRCHEIRPGAKSSRWLRVQITFSHPDDIGQHSTSSGWHPVLVIGHLDEMWSRTNSPGWLEVEISLCHPDDIRQHGRSSGWHPVLVIGHLDEMWSRTNSPGWLEVEISLCHPDDIRQHGRSSGWHPALVINHLDEILPGAYVHEVALCLKTAVFTYHSFNHLVRRYHHNP